MNTGMNTTGPHRRRLVLVLFLAVFSACDTPTTPPAEPLTLVYTALGASDAVGIGALPLTQGYVYELERRMLTVRAAVDLNNLGISGARIDEFLSSMLPQAIASDPDIVTVWTGPNDIIAGADPREFRSRLDTLLSELGARTTALVFVADVPDLTRAPLFRLAPDPDVTPERIAGFNAHIRAGVGAHGAVLVRLSTMPLDDSMFSIDGFHPSNKGHEAIAEAFWSEIAPFL